VDALVPFADTLDSSLASGSDLRLALGAGADAATRAAAATAELRPALGRARPLAEKSLGHADPGATSLALVVSALAKHLSGAPGGGMTR
jgi:dihydroxyacetone kinase